MKKSVILLASLMISGCACFAQSDKEEEYADTQAYEIDRYREPAYTPRRATIVKQDYQPAYIQARRPDEYRTYRTTYDTIYEIDSPESIRYYRVTNKPEPLVMPAPAPQPVQNPVVYNAPAPVIYTAADVYTAPAAVPCNNCNSTVQAPVATAAPQTAGYAAASDSAAPCPEKVTENKVPVEVVYKKTVTRTVYEPKTYENVTYEKEPYVPGQLN